MTDDTLVAPTRDVLPMSVANMAFLVNKLGEDCTPLQYLRELTTNSIQSIALQGGPGDIVWDVNWPHYDLDGVYKLACVDNGVGMTGPEMVRYINKLSSSIHLQSATSNFGVGAKIAAAPRNPHGLVYMSWKDGQGAMVWLHYDQEQRVYGLKRWAKNLGEYWTPISDEVKPTQITYHGTMVTLLGLSDDDNTLDPPPGTPMRSRWVLRYLNTRYFRFPDGVTVKSREGWELPRSNTKHNFLRKVEGQGAWLDRNSESSGIVNLTDAKAHWWILRPDVDNDSGHNAPGGHMAALFQDELYEMAVSRGGIARLQAFGCIFGAERLAIYVEPDDGLVTSNTSRSHLMVDGEPLDWPRWASEFRALMPDEIVTLQEEIGGRSGERDHRKAIEERLRQIKDLLSFSRYRPTPDGAVSVNADSTMQGGGTRDRGEPQAGTASPGKKGGRSGDIYALFAETGGVPADPVETYDTPDVMWVSIEEKTRHSNDGLDDRAGRFLLDQNKIIANADFRVFKDMIGRWEIAYQKDVPSAGIVIKEVVHEWFQQQLVETIVSALALRKTGNWNLDELNQLWSESALTAAMLPRWHINMSIKRSLGQRLGSLK